MQTPRITPNPQGDASIQDSDSIFMSEALEGVFDPLQETYSGADSYQFSVGGEMLTGELIKLSVSLRLRKLKLKCRSLSRSLMASSGSLINKAAVLQSSGVVLLKGEVVDLKFKRREDGSFVCSFTLALEGNT